MEWGVAAACGMVAAFAACESPSRPIPGSSPSRLAAPPPAAIVWPTKAELESQSGDNVGNLDAIVFLALAAVGFDDQAARDRGVASAVLLVKQALRQLMLDVQVSTSDHPADDPAFYAALVDFERRANLAVDGRFTVSEWKRLNYLATIATESNLSLPMRFVVGGPGAADAAGTWTMKGDTIARPINVGEIQCLRSAGTCEESRAEVTIPSQADSTSAVIASSFTYDIEAWTADEVRAVHRTVCRANTLTLNWKTKAVLMVTTDLTADGCPMLGRLTSPIVTNLEDGLTVSRDVYAARRAELSAFPIGKFYEDLRLTAAAR